MLNFDGAFAGKTVLVTGHTGFKGAWLSLWLTRLGAHVVGYALPPDADREVVLSRAFASLEQFFDQALPIFHAAQADAELGQVLADFIEANDLGPHRGVRTLGDYLCAEQAAGRAHAGVDADAVALLLIDAAFSRSARRQLMRPDESDERLPSPERLLAALNLMLDFDMIEKGVAAGSPKYMEWYGAFGLLVTIVWLYLEILRLLAKLSSRR